MTPDAAIAVALPYLLHVAAGAVGGNVVGMALRTKSWGPLVNSLAGAVGGAAAVYGAQAVAALEQAAEALSGNANLAEVAIGLAGGAGLALAASAFKQPD